MRLSHFLAGAALAIGLSSASSALDSCKILPWKDCQDAIIPIPTITVQVQPSAQRVEEVRLAAQLAYDEQRRASIRRIYDWCRQGGHTTGACYVSPEERQFAGLPPLVHALNPRYIS